MTQDKPKGRAVPPLPQYTFATSGVTVGIRRLGPFTIDEINKANRKKRPRPTPPMVTVAVGEDQIKLSEPNPSDPDYLQAVKEWEEWMQLSAGQKMTDLMINYCIVCKPDPEVVADRRVMLRMIDPEEEALLTDQQVYVQHYLCATAEEIQALQAFIMGQSMPTQEAVEEHIEAFPGKVQGSAPIPV